MKAKFSTNRNLCLLHLLSSKSVFYLTWKLSYDWVQPPNNNFKWLPLKGRAWLRRFDDVTRVEKSCVAKGINRKKAKEKYFIIANKYTLSPNI